MTTIRARYANGVLTPLDPLDLSEGCEVSVTVNGAEAAAAPEESSPEGETLLEMFARIRLDPSELPDDYPSDASINYKHYLYGHPKEGE